MIENKLSIFEMFSGYGGASFALKKLGIDFDCVGYSEIDKFACKCYEQNHKGKAVGDCTKINPWTLDYFDLLTGGFPCQAFSVAGKGLGELDTRGTLFNEIIRIAEVKKPKWMLLENVKGLTNKKHKGTFEKILSELKRIGYTVHWKVLNSKEHGIPQNRERVFFVCFRDIEDSESWGGFPEKEELKIFLKNILEDEVDDKYLLSDKMLEKITFNNKNNGEIANLNKGGERGSVYSEDSEVMSCLSATDYKQPKQIIQVGMINQVCKKRVHDTPKEINEFLRASKGLWTITQIAVRLELPKTQVEHYFRTDQSRAIPSPKVWKEIKELLHFRDDYDSQVMEIYEKEVEFESTRRVYSDEGCSPTISSTNADKIIQLNNPSHSNNRVYSDEGVSPSLNTMQGGNRQPFILSQPLKFLNRNQKNLQGEYSGCVDSCNTNGININGQIRKLTPKECFRLMGFLNDEINLNGISNSQRYKLAGNGWDINLVSKICSSFLNNTKGDNPKSI